MTFQMISVAVLVFLVPLRSRRNQFAALGGEPALAHSMDQFFFLISLGCMYRVHFPEVKHMTEMKVSL